MLNVNVGPLHNNVATCRTENYHDDDTDDGDNDNIEAFIERDNDYAGNARWKDWLYFKKKKKEEAVKLVLNVCLVRPAWLNEPV